MLTYQSDHREIFEIYVHAHSSLEMVYKWVYKTFVSIDLDISQVLSDPATFE